MRPRIPLAPALAGLTLLALGLGGCRFQEGLAGRFEHFNFHSRVENRQGTVTEGGRIARGSTLDLTAEARPEPREGSQTISARQLRRMDTCLRETLTTEPEALFPVVEIPERVRVLYRASGTIVLRAERPGQVDIGWQGRRCTVERTSFQVVEPASLLPVDPGRLALVEYAGEIRGEAWEDELAPEVIALLPGSVARLDLEVLDRAGEGLAYAEGYLEITVDGDDLFVRTEGHELVLDATWAVPGRRHAVAVRGPTGLAWIREVEVVDPAELRSLALRHYWVPDLGGVALKATATLRDGRPVLQPPVRWPDPFVAAHRIEENLAIAGRLDLIALDPVTGAEPEETVEIVARLEGLSASVKLPPGLWEPTPRPAPPVVGCQSSGGKGGLSLAFVLLLGLTLLTFRRWGS